MKHSTRMMGAALGLLLACGIEPEVTEPETGTPALSREGTWSRPVNLGTVVNSPFIDFTPEISPDGLSLYFGSDRPGGQSPAPDIWVSRRASLDASWGAPVNL